MIGYRISKNSKLWLPSYLYILDSSMMGICFYFSAKSGLPKDYMCENNHLQTSCILVARLSKLKECKLDKNPRNFHFYHNLEKLINFS